MVNNCSVSCCKEKYSTSVMMHSIPKAVDASIRWINAIRQSAPDFKPTAHTKICSLHFKQTDYSMSVVSNRLLLKKEAVPSIFRMTKQIKSTVIYEHSYCKQVAEIPINELMDSLDADNSCTSYAGVSEENESTKTRDSTTYNSCTSYAGVSEENESTKTRDSTTYSLNTPEALKYNVIHYKLFPSINEQETTPSEECHSIPIKPCIDEQETTPSEECHCIPIKPCIDEQESTPSEESHYKPFKHCIDEQETTPSEESHYIPFKPRKRKHYIGDFKLDDMESPDCRLQFWNASQNSLRSKERKIKELRKKTYRLQQKIFNLHHTIDKLRNENKMNDDCFTTLKVGGFDGTNDVNSADVFYFSSQEW